MLLTITTTHSPARDLGFLLHKHPDRVQSFDLPFGRAHVFYLEASDERCTAAMLLDVDPVGLVRTRRGPGGGAFLLRQYVNDRPYVASSFLSVAISRVFGTAMSGRCADRPVLVDQAIPLTARLSVLPCRGGEHLLRRLFEPLGYTVDTVGHPLDPNNPDWGLSPYHTVELRGTCRLADLLTHLYVLIPVLDNDKHYWVGSDEVEKLLGKGEGWLAAHPERELITRRYLKSQPSLAKLALDRLIEEESPDDEEVATRQAGEESAVETPICLNDRRLEAVIDALRSSGACQVIDLGCGEGRLLRLLLNEKRFDRVVGMDVSHRALERAKRHLRWDRLSPAKRQRIELLHGSLMYRDQRLAGFDAAACVEVIEHLDRPRLALKQVNLGGFFVVAPRGS